MMITIELRGEEMTLDVDAEVIDEDPSVGTTFGYSVYGAKNLDTGEALTLTDAESEEIAEHLTESRLGDD